MNLRKIMILTKAKLKMYGFNKVLFVLFLLSVCSIIYQKDQFVKEQLPEEFYFQIFNGSMSFVYGIMNSFFLVMSSSNFVARERSQGVVKTSIFSGVSKLDYLFGTALPIILTITFYNIFLFLLIYRPGIPNFWSVVLVCLWNIIQHTIIGVSIGLIVKNSYQAFLLCFCIDLCWTILKYSAIYFFQYRTLVEDFRVYSFLYDFAFKGEPLNMIPISSLFLTFALSLIFYLYVYNIKLGR